MSSPTVTILLRARKSDGSRAHFPAVLSPNGRLKSNVGIVNGQQQQLRNSVYYLRYRLNGKRVWECAGTDAGSVLTLKLQREHQLKSAKLGLEAPASAIRRPTHTGSSKERLALIPTIQQYVSDIHEQRGRRTANSYEHDLTTFADDCGKTFLDELTRDDVCHYIAQLSREGKMPKTISNRCVTLAAFLRRFGADANIIVKADQPRIHRKLPAVYTHHQVKALLAASNPEDRLIWEVFLAAGLREQELSHLGWEDVIFESDMLHLHAKPDLGFTLKDAEERQIPLPSKLMAKLKARRKMRPNDRLVFPTKSGKVDGHLLRRLKKVAFAANLNCGLCKNRAGVKCKKAAVCSKWQLHSFRRTAATRWHEAGLSVPSVQRMLGHADVQTTMSYLAAQDFSSGEFRASIDSAYADMAA